MTHIVWYTVLYLSADTLYYILYTLVLTLSALTNTNNNYTIIISEKNIKSVRLRFFGIL